MKKRVERNIMWEARTQLKSWKARNPVFLVFHWVEKDKRRDHDNVAFGKKFIQDALVSLRVLEGDGWKHVIGFLDVFSVNKNNPGVEVVILEVSNEQCGKRFASQD
jgi:Holliday junction resolvase RusA-like endonuclease